MVSVDSCDVVSGNPVCNVESVSGDLLDDGSVSGNLVGEGKLPNTEVNTVNESNTPKDTTELLQTTEKQIEPISRIDRTANNLKTRFHSIGNEVESHEKSLNDVEDSITFKDTTVTSLEKSVKTSVPGVSKSSSLKTLYNCTTGLDNNFEDALN